MVWHLNQSSLSALHPAPPGPALVETGHPELSLRGEGTGGEGGRLYKLCPGYSLAQMEIHKGQGGGIGAWKCNYEEKEQERLLTLYSSCWAGPASVALG